MTETQTIVETKLLQIFRMLPEEKRTEIMDFVMLIDQKSRKEKEWDKFENSEKIVEKTWGCISLDRETLIYIAEDKELEYEI